MRSASRTMRRLAALFLIGGVLVSAGASAGVTVGPDLVLDASGAGSDQFRPEVAHSAGVFLVVWYDTRNEATSGVDIYGARVRAADGVVLDDVAIPICTAEGDQYGVGIAGGDAGFFVIWRTVTALDDRGYPQATELRGARVSADDGAVLDPDGILLDAEERTTEHRSPGREQAVAASGSTYFVIWQDNRESDTSCEMWDCNWLALYGARIDAATGTVLDPAGVAISVTGGEVEQLEVVADDELFYAVYTDSIVPTDAYFGSPYMARVRVDDGQVLDPDGVVIPDAGIHVSEVRWAAVRDATLLVTWTECHLSHDHLAWECSGTWAAGVDTTDWEVLDPGGAKQEHGLYSLGTDDRGFFGLSGVDEFYALARVEVTAEGIGAIERSPFLDVGGFSRLAWGSGRYLYVYQDGDYGRNLGEVDARVHAVLLDREGGDADVDADTDVDGDVDGDVDADTDADGSSSGGSGCHATRHGSGLPGLLLVLAMLLVGRTARPR